jgi:hypothetical protein
MPSPTSGKICTVILAAQNFPLREVSVTAEEARRLLIWVGRRKLGQSTTARFALALAFPAGGKQVIKLTDHRDVLGLNHRTGNRRTDEIARRISTVDRRVEE